MNSTKIITMLLLLLVLFTLLTATRTTAVSGVASSDGSYSTDMLSETGQPAAAGGVVRYLVPHIRSAEFSAGGGGRVSTVITATNGGSTSCSVTVEHYFAFNADMIPECSVTVNLAPLLATGADTANICSRTIAGDRWTLCTSTCNPSLGFMQGKALIRVPESCAGAVAFDARLYHSDASENVVAINKLTTMRLRD